MQTFFGHAVFIKLSCDFLVEKTFQLPNNSTSMMEARILKTFNIRYVCRSMFVSLKKAFRFGKLSRYSNSFIYILHKIDMEECLKIFRGIFVQMMLKDVWMEQLYLLNFVRIKCLVKSMPV